MSESGKIPLSSMTPERIEEIKERLNERQARKGTLSREEVELMDALAALEESQQQNELTAATLSAKLHTAENDRDWWRQHAEALIEIGGSHKVDLVSVSRQLVEAQTIITRQAKVMKEAGIALNAAQLLAFFIEKDGKPVDGFRFREIARNMMTLLELMDWSALGNKEGSDKA